MAESINYSIDDVSATEWDAINKSALAQKRKDSVLPEDAQARKDIPVYTGFINYFPRAIAAVAKISLIGGLQHGQTAETLHWDRSKSGDELDAMMRHILDGDWEQVAWRAMANLEKKEEAKAEAEINYRTTTFHPTYTSVPVTGKE